MLNQWWIDAGRILASENPRDKELDALRTQEFEIVISLLDEQQQQPRYTVLRRRMQVGSVTFCRYLNPKRPPWISWNALRQS